MKQLTKKQRKILIISAIALAFAIALTVALILIFSNKPCKHHRDKDDNGLCDRCGEKLGIAFNFYAINDLHGKFDDSSQQPGVDELTMYFMEKQMVEDNVILLSSGDMWQGSSESNQTKGEIIVDWMNELGFVSQTLGNHEFDWGEEYVTKNAEKAEFPFLAINIFDKKTNQRVAYAEPSVMIEKSGIKIGIIGAIGDCYSSIASEKSAGFSIITGSALSALIRDEAAKLRSEGASFIVLSIHDGYDDSFSGMHVIPDSKASTYFDLTLTKKDVDLVFEGHTHQSYVLMDTNSVYHLQNGGENKGISHVKVYINPLTGTASVEEPEIIPSATYAKSAQNGLRDNLLDKYADKIAWTKEIVATLDRQLSRDELGTLVAGLYYEFGVEKWGGNYDIVLGGGLLSTRSPGYLAKGNLNYSMIQMIFPFDNELVLCSCKGWQLNQVFFKTTNDKYYIYCGEYGESVRKNIENDKTYYVIVDTYTSTYAPNGLVEIERFNEEYYARDLLLEYFEKNYGINN